MRENRKGFDQLSLQSHANGLRDFAEKYEEMHFNHPFYNHGSERRM